MGVSIRTKIIMVVLFLVLSSTMIVGFYVTHLKLQEILTPTLTGILLQKETLLIIAITFIMAFIIAIAFSYTITKPIDDLILGTQLVSAGKLDREIDKFTDDEIGRLVDAFNEMNVNLMHTTEQKTKFSEEAILEKNKAELIIQSMGDGVIVTDKDQKIVLFNQGAENIFEIEAKKVLGNHLLHYKRLFGLEKNILDRIYNPDFIKKKQSLSTEIELLQPTHTVLKVDIAPLKNEKGNVLGTVLVWHDITQQKEIENMKTEFVSMVSHELRTPLTSIKGYAALLQDPKLGLLTEKQNRAILIINKESDRLTYLINDILDLSKLEAGKIKLNIEPVNLEECIDNAASLEDVKKKNISFRKRIPKNMPLVPADKGKITQVFTNLISNAAKFTKPKGKIMVMLSNREKDDFVVVKVKDTGIGIAKKHIPNLFNKFYQVESHLRRNVGGTGLGLPIVKEIVTLHKGEISVKSKIKQGTSIIFKLPKLKEKKDEEEKDKKQKTK